VRKGKERERGKEGDGTVKSVKPRSRKVASSTNSDRVQKTPEGHMSSDGTTARQADDQRRSVDDVSVPCQRPEHNRQLDTVA